MKATKPHAGRQIHNTASIKLSMTIDRRIINSTHDEHTHVASGLATLHSPAPKKNPQPTKNRRWKNQLPKMRSRK